MAENTVVQKDFCPYHLEGKNFVLRNFPNSFYNSRIVYNMNNLHFTFLYSYAIGFLLWNIDNNFCPYVR